MKTMHLRMAVCFLAISMVAVCSAQGAPILAQYGFGEGALGTATLSPTATDPNVTGSAMVGYGSGNPGNLLDPRPGYAGMINPDGGDTISFGGWQCNDYSTVGTWGAGAGPFYIEFTLTANNGTVLNLSGLSLDVCSGGSPYGEQFYYINTDVDAANGGWTAATSLLGGPKMITAVSTPAPNDPVTGFGMTQLNYQTDSYDLSGRQYQGLSSITFRIYVNSAGCGASVADNITITGAAVPTPEPATMALLAIGGIGALLRRRK